MTEHNPNPEIPEGAKVIEPDAPAEPKERTIEDDFPLTDFKDNILVLFKHVLQNNPVSLRVNGSAWLAEEIMKGGRHSVSGTNGHVIVFNGNDVLWADCITAEENRQRAIAQAKAQLAAQEAAEAKKAEEERAAKLKAGAEAKKTAEVEALAKAEAEAEAEFRAKVEAARKKLWWKRLRRP